MQDKEREDRTQRKMLNSDSTYQKEHPTFDISNSSNDVNRRVSLSNVPIPESKLRTPTKFINSPMNILLNRLSKERPTYPARHEPFAEDELDLDSKSSQVLDDSDDEFIPESPQQPKTQNISIHSNGSKHKYFYFSEPEPKPKRPLAFDHREMNSLNDKIHLEDTHFDDLSKNSHLTSLVLPKPSESVRGTIASSSPSNMSGLGATPVAAGSFLYDRLHKSARQSEDQPHLNWDPNEKISNLNERFISPIKLRQRQLETFYYKQKPDQKETLNAETRFSSSSIIASSSHFSEGNNGLSLSGKLKKHIEEPSSISVKLNKSIQNDVMDENVIGERHKEETTKKILEKDSRKSGLLEQILTVYGDDFKLFPYHMDVHSIEQKITELLDQYESLVQSNRSDHENRKAFARVLVWLNLSREVHLYLSRQRESIGNFIQKTFRVIVLLLGILVVLFIMALVFYLLPTLSGLSP